MSLKVIHIDRKKIKYDAEVRDFWENVLKPKWEARARKLGEKIRAELMNGAKIAPPKLITQKEKIVPGKKLKIVIEVDGNSLNIKRIADKDIQKTRTKKGAKTGTKKRPSKSK